MDSVKILRRTQFGNPVLRAKTRELSNAEILSAEIQELIAEDSNSNVPLAKAAIAIYNDVENLEKSRYKAAVIFREEFAKKKSSAKN